MRLRIHNLADTKDLRRRLRRKSTPAEKILWNALRNRKLDGQKFTRQHGIGAYVADFHCSKYRLVIELDGGIHQRKDIKMNDLVRSEYIEAWEIKIIRFTNQEVLTDLNGVLNKIRMHFAPLLF